MQEKSFSKIKRQSPVSIIVHSTNIIGRNLAKILLEQGSKVILIDRFDQKSKNLILELKKIGNVDFVDLSGLEDLMKNIGRVDYLFYLQSEFLLSNTSFTSKDFLEESNNLNLCLKVSQKYNAKITLTTNIELNEKLVHNISDPENQSVSYSAEELQKYSETLTAEYHDKSKINARILRIGTILGNESNIDRYPVLKGLFEDSVKNNAINICGEGLDVHYLIHLSDLIYGILKLTFSSSTNGEVLSLCNNNEYSTLSIAYKLLELNPNATEIKFLPNTQKRRVLHSQYVPAPNAQEYSWRQKRSIETSVSETLELKYIENNKKWKQKKTSSTNTYQAKLEEIRRQKTGKRKTKGNSSIVKTPTGEILSKIFKPLREIHLRKNLTPKATLKGALLAIILITVFYFFLYPLISIGAGSFALYRSANKLSDQTSSFNIADVSKELSYANKNAKNLNKNFEKLNWLFGITQQASLYDDISSSLYGLDMGTEGAIALLEGVSPLIKYGGEFEPALGFQEDSVTTTREYTNLLKDLERNADQISESGYKITQALNIIAKLNTKLYPNFVQPKLEEIQTTVLAFEEQIKTITNIINFLPESLGVSERQRYLILLQNPGELRSTGGWISSYAIVGIEGGQIRQLKVEDVYNLDGELKNQGKVFPPPLEMTKALEVKDVGLSLSNWEPNFPEAAKEAEFFIKEAGEAHRIDGVITIDIYLLQDLLDQWNGIYIPGEQDLITSDNLYEKVFFLHENFSPGQSQKATFLTSLADEVIKKIFSSNLHENKSVLTILLSALESKNMLINFKNLEAQKYFSDNGWAGEISPDNYKLPFSIEWNWGANKANLYLEREQRVKTEIMSLNDVKYDYSVILKNNSTSKTYPQGEYKNYTRIYLPEKAEVLSVKGFFEDEYQTYNTKGFKILAGWYNVPISTTKELYVSYTLKDTQNIFDTEGNNIALTSKIFKQPGTSRADAYRLEIIYPENWILLEQDDFEKARVQLIKHGLLDKEKSFSLEWTYQ